MYDCGNVETSVSTVTCFGIVQVCVCLCVCMHACVCLCLCMCVCVCVCVCMSVCMLLILAGLAKINQVIQLAMNNNNILYTTKL